MVQYHTILHEARMLEMQNIGQILNFREKPKAFCIFSGQKWPGAASDFDDKSSLISRMSSSIWLELKQIKLGIYHFNGS